MKAVLDANVWISALVFGGKPRQIFERALHQGYTVIISEEMIAETRRNLERKFPDFVAEYDALLAAFAFRLQKVTLGKYNVRICRDPDDNKVLETALTGQAMIIISGDNDLLVLEKFEVISIVSPSEFLKDLKKHETTGEVMELADELLKRYHTAFKNLADR